MIVNCQQQVSFKVTSEARGRVSGDGVELAFGYWPGRRAPVVGIHGLTASYLSFAGVGERLAGRRSLFAVDLRGRGDSEKPDGPYGMTQHARDVCSRGDEVARARPKYRCGSFDGRPCRDCIGGGSFRASRGIDYDRRRLRS